MRTSLIALALIALGFLLHWAVRGIAETKDEAYKWVILVAAPTVLFLAGLFLVNLFRAPYLIYADEHNKMQGLIGVATAQKVAAEARAQTAQDRIRELERQLATKDGGKQTPDNNAQIRAAIRKVLLFPNAVQDSTAPKTMIETMLTNQTPRKLFAVLIQYDENAIGAVPGSGPLLRDFLHNYYQFDNDIGQLENNVLGRIGGMVAVRFHEGWGIYLRYAILRFGGMSRGPSRCAGQFLKFRHYMGRCRTRLQPTVK